MLAMGQLLIIDACGVEREADDFGELCCSLLCIGVLHHLRI